MRVAHISAAGQALIALEHAGDFYRVDVLDALLGSPLPADIVPLASRFSTRIFSLGWAGLSEHVEELQSGFQVPAAKVASEWTTTLLPPTGEHPALIEVPATGSSEIALRLNARTLLGAGAIGRLQHQAGPLKVAPAVALVLGDDLHLPDPDTVLRSVAGYALALAWSSVTEEREGLAQGVGPGPGRDVGTHIGPCLVHPRDVHTADPLTVTLSIGSDPEVPYAFPFDPARLGRVLARAAKFGDLYAGDVLLLVGQPRLPVVAGQLVTACANEAFGTLEGRLGGTPSQRYV